MECVLCGSVLQVSMGHKGGRNVCVVNRMNEGSVPRMCKGSVCYAEVCCNVKGLWVINSGMCVVNRMNEESVHAR